MPPVSTLTPGDGSAASLALGSRPFLRTAKAFVLLWISLNWVDSLCMLILAGITFGVYYLPVPVTRTFPITFDGSGDIIYPEWAYPYRGWIIPSWLSGIVSIGGPMVIYLAAQIRIRSIWDASSAIMGTIWAVLLAALFQVVIKTLIGGFRPYFLDVCMPDISRASTHNRTGLNGVGFRHVMYTIEVCTQPDAGKLKTAITSFPSGHSTAAFAGFGFLFLWTNAKLKVWADHAPAFWKLTVTMLPLLVALAMVSSLTIDAAHNWYDIVAGSVIGIVTAIASYRASYAAIWDWRFNHLGLQKKAAFVYTPEGQNPDYATQTFTRSAGWGETRQWLPQQLDSARSSAVLTRQAGAIHGAEGEQGGDSRREHGTPTRRGMPEGEAV